jgi:hypothetical protein
MKQTRRHVNRMIFGVAAGMVLAVTGSSAPAQDATSTPAPSTSRPTTTIKVPRTEATPQMIEEAIQRSHARTEWLRTTGRPEAFGSEEPFTYVPGADFR